MSQTTLKFVFRNNGVLTDVDSVVLCDPTSTYGVKRLDNNGIIVAANQAMTHDSTGIYSYPAFTDPAPNLIYLWYAKFTLGSVTNYAPFTQVGGTDVVQDSYSSVIDADAYFNARMFTSAWANSDSEQKQQALNQATAIINLFRYVGCKTDSAQDFEFPRKYIQFEGILLPEDEVPKEILEAQYEIALALRKGIDPQREISSIGVTSRGFASVRTTYDSNRSIPEYILNGVPSSLAWALMSPFFQRDNSRSLHLRRVS